LATFTGYLASVPVCDTDSEASANILSAGSDFGSAAGGIDTAADAIGGSIGAGSPVYSGASLSGAVVSSFKDDFYFRIHISPAVVDLGNILGEIEQTVIVWNAYFTGKQCSALDSENGDEIELTGESAPFTLLPLEEALYEAVIGTAGSASFETSYTWTFPDGETVSVVFTGTRLALFSYPPNRPWSEFLAWLTNIMTGHDGSEQRASARQAPRQYFQFDCQVGGAAAISKIDAKIHARHPYAWGLPIWGEQTLHTGTLSAAAESISISTAYADYRPGGLAAIWQSPDLFEVVSIDQVNELSLDLERPLNYTWTGRKLIMPVRVAIVDGEVVRSDRDPALATVSAEFQVIDNIMLSGYVPEDTYKGLPVLLSPSLFQGNAIPGKYTRKVNIIDFNTGTIQVDSWHTYDAFETARRSVFHNKAAVWNYRLFLHEMAGRRNLCWIPTRRNDLVLAADAGAADVNLTINSIGYAQNFGSDHALKNHLAFIRPDGTAEYRQITGASEGDPGEEIITIDSVLGETVTNAKFKLSLMARHRQVSDRIEIQWIGPGRAESTTGWVQKAA
jgi:hypothetical protein